VTPLRIQQRPLAVHGCTIVHTFEMDTSAVLYRGTFALLRGNPLLRALFRYSAALGNHSDQNTITWHIGHVRRRSQRRQRPRRPTQTMQLQWLLLLPLLPTALGQAGSNDTLLWGAYRPNLYFGLRPRIPESLMTGLIWFGTQDYQSFSSEWGT
jgi:hypothetical protein